MTTPEAIERRARELAGDIHVHGAIPARHWREAIAETLEPPRDETELHRLNRVMTEVLTKHVAQLHEEARAHGW